MVIEALALALPLYPRAPGAALGEAVFDRPQDQAADFANVNTPAELARLG